MNHKIVTLDVRDDLRNGREPFTKIMAAVVALRPGEQLLLVVPFEPTPLYEVMAKRGFHHDTQLAGTGDWEVLFSRDHNSSEPRSSRREEASPEIRNEPGVLASTAAQIVEVDARGLEPPQPLVRILEAVAALPVGAKLHARTDRRPMHLYPQLEARGFAAETLEQADGSFLTHVYRA